MSGTMGRHSLLLMLVLAAILFQDVTASRSIGNSRRNLLTTQSCDASADYALVLDGSGSLEPAGFADLKAAAAAILSATTNPGNRYYANIFTSALQLILPGWGNEAVTSNAIQGAAYTGGNTNMRAGLLDAQAKFNLPGSPNSVKLCFLITDGEFNEGGDPSDIATAMKNAGVTLITVGVGGDVDDGFLKGIASNPNLYFAVSSTTELVATIRDIVFRVCPLVCKNQAVTLTTTSDSCTVPRCTAALINSGTPCFDVYDSGAQGTPVLFAPPGPLVVPVGQSNTTIRVTFNDQTPCDGRVSINCQKTNCNRSAECYTQLEDVMCASRVCENSVCVYKPKMGGLSCNDSNPCTSRDVCSGAGYGPNHCAGTLKNCALTSPPSMSLRQCYDVPYCDETDGKCVWPFSSTAMRSVLSANAYCSTWAGAFATQLVSNGTTPNPSGSIAYSDCFAACSADVCAKQVPACSCMSTAASSSRAMAGTCPPCPADALAEGWCDTYFTCSTTTNGAVFTDTSDGTNPNATCWYPDANVKNGAGGLLYPCAGKIYNEYSLTGGTSVSQCMGCLSLGSAYDRNSSVCYAGNISIPVDP